MSAAQPCPLSKDTRVYALAASSAVAGGIIALLLRKAIVGSEKKVGPTESRNIYETKASINQYLEFHFTDPALQYGKAKEAGIDLSKAFEFPARLAKYAERHSLPTHRGKALDVGCAVGRTTFELAKTFQQAVGVDLSNGFIEAAEIVRTKGELAFDGPGQGHIFEKRVAKIPAGVDPSKCKFLVRDCMADNFVQEFGNFDVVIGANLICRVPDPRDMVRKFKGLVTVGGLLILASPYSWWAGATDPSSWFGGTEEGGRSETVIKAFLMELGFELLEEGVAPFLIRDHERRYQNGYSHLTVWRRTK